MPAPTGRTVHTLDPTGLVRDWLVSPAWSCPADDLDAVLDADGSPWGDDGRWVLTNGPDVAPLKARLHARRPLVTDQELPEPVEGGPVRWTAPGGQRVDEGAWSRVRTGRDGLLDWSRFCYTPEYRHAVAATVLEVDQPEVRTFEVGCTGPFALWVGDELVATGTGFGYMQGNVRSVPLLLPSGASRVVLSTWQVAFREVRHVASLRVLGLPVRVVIPSPGADEYAAALAEQALDAVASRSWVVREGRVELTGPPGVALVVSAEGGPSVRVRLLDGRAGLSVAELQGRAASTGHDGPADLEGGEATASMLSTGETRLRVQIDDERCPVHRDLLVAVLPPRRRGTSVGAPETWRRELLEHVAQEHAGTARALARHELDPGGTQVEAVDLDPPLAMVTARADCADFEAVGLMHLWHRVPPQRWAPGQRERVRDALRGFKYWIDQPGLDAMCYFTENHQLVWHTAELLVGRTFGTDTFGNTGWLGAEHAEHGRAMVLEWMRRKLQGGFSEFDSNAYLAIDSLALVSLVELCDDDEVRALAEALLDKVLLTLACNSWRGVHGTAHGRSYTPTLRSSRLEETAPIMWSLWGAGALNAAVLPATALTTARAYRVPEVVRAVATHAPDHWEGRQVYRGRYRPHHDLLARPYGSDLRIWRTPDAMLSCVQDYRAGLPGLQEHVWGATLGPEVQVFATFPASDTNSPSARPNAWAGQRVLPRAHQHRDSVLSVHGLPDRAPVGPAGGTRVWFPAAQLDELVHHGAWLAGRLADGYVAVAADGGLVPARSGDEAFQAWYPRGDGRAYVATVGRAADDGTFAQFVAALAQPEFGADPGGAPRVRWTARDGRVLDLGWEGPFCVDDVPEGFGPDGRPQDPPHVSNPAVRQEFGADRLEAQWAGHRLVLDLASGRRLEPPGVLDGVPGAGESEDRTDPVSAAGEVPVAGEDLDNARLAAAPLDPLPVEEITRERLLAVGDAVAERTWETGLREWFWGEGVCLLGLVRLARAAGRPFPVDVLGWLTQRLEQGVQVDHVNHLAPATALAIALREQPDLRARLELPLLALVDWIDAPGAASYDDDGTLEHWPGGVWADTVFMAGLPLAHVGLLTGDSARVAAFAHQVERHVAVLQDTETGLFVHGSHRGEVVRCFWGRANAWCALALVELLEVAAELGDEGVERAGAGRSVDVARSALSRQLAALARHQPEHGVWSVLVDEHPETAGIVETSAAAGIGAAMLRAARVVDLPDEVVDAGWRAVRGALAYVGPDGTLTRTSAGTVLQLVPFGYSVVRDDRIQPWGQGLALHAVAAALEALAAGPGSR